MENLKCNFALLSAFALEETVCKMLKSIPNLLSVTVTQLVCHRKLLCHSSSSSFRYILVTSSASSFSLTRKAAFLKKCNVYSLSCSSPLHLSAFSFKSKSKKASGKIQQLIRPADAADVVDLTEIENDMKSIVDKLKNDFVKNFRVGSDIPLEELQVNIDDDPYALNEIAQISKPSPRLIELDLVSFPEFVPAVKNAIEKSKWNLNPSAKGTIIKVPIPQATADHRANVAKAAKQRLGTCKNDLHRLVLDLEKEIKHKHVAEDLEKILKQQLKIYSNHYAAEADKIYKGKEQEILHPS